MKIDRYSNEIYVTTSLWAKIVNRSKEIPLLKTNFIPKELSERNSHGVTLEVLQKKVKSFELAIPLYFGWFLSPKDSRSIYDRAMILFKNLYESCDEFKQNFGEFSSMLNWGSAMNFYRYV